MISLSLLCAAFTNGVRALTQKPFRSVLFLVLLSLAIGAGGLAAPCAAADDAAQNGTADKAPDKTSADKASPDKASSDKAASDKTSPDKASSDKGSDKAPAPKAPAAAAPATVTPPPVDTALQGVQEVWDILLQNRIKELTTINDEAEALQKKLPAAGKALNTSLTIIEKDYQRVAAIARVSRGLPVELTVILERLRRITDRLTETLRPLEGSLSSLQTRLTEISLLEKDAAQSNTEETPELRDFLKKLAQTESRIETLRVRINRVLTPARNLLNTVKDRTEEVRKNIPTLWRDYYLESTGRLYDMNTWSDMGQSLDVLRETYALRITAELPQNLGEWVSVFLRGLFTFVPLFLLVIFLRRLIRRTAPGVSKGLERMSRNSLPLLCYALSFHFAAWSPQGELYHVLSIVGTLLMSVGQMALAWDLYTFNRSDMPRLTPLWPLFAPLLGGLVLLLLNFPGPVLGVCWVLILAGSLWREHQRPIQELPFPLVVNLLRFHAPIMWLGMVMAVFGWGRLSILVCMAYAAVAVSVQQAVGFMRLVNVLSSNMPQKGGKALVGGVLLALAVPCLLVVATLATGLWILAYPGGGFLLAHVATLDFNIGKTSFNLFQVLLILSAFYVTRSVITVGRSFLRELPSHGLPMDQSLVGPIQVGYTYTLWGLFGLYTLSALGFSLTSLAVVAGGLSVGIGFGLQNIINNFVSGVLVIFGQTLREGDVIEVGNLVGTVKKINVRSTIVETPDNASIFVPNAEFLSGRLTNWTRNGRMVRREVTVGVAYGSPVEDVIRLLMEVAEKHPRILRYPEPFVLFTQFADSALTFALRFWIADINHGLTVETDVRVAIEKAFREAEVEIAFPQLDVHIKTGQSEPEPVAVSAADSAEAGSAVPLAASGTEPAASERKLISISNVPATEATAPLHGEPLLVPRGAAQRGDS